jgi:hypothetical protein
LKLNRIHLSVAALLALAACTDEKKCGDFCGDGNVCVNDTCVPLACTPACGPGTACQMGTCVAVQALTCTEAYPGCSACDTSGAAPAWVGLCGTRTSCDATSDTCIPVTLSLHEAFAQPGLPLEGPFASGYQATQACLTCHVQAAAQVMGSAHYAWKGPTPDLVDFTDLTTLVNPGTIGKVNLVNNFCVSVPTNEKRCDQCHAGYGGDPDPARPQKSARGYTAADSSIPLEARVDCLVCHADSATYSKAPKDWGRPNPTVDLAAAARSVQLPDRNNCGVCHFYAGGGDNVKLMGTGLRSPTFETDVHMGAVQQMTCADCHAAAGHQFKGAGVHTPTHTARTDCADCHGATPHEGVVPSGGDVLDSHTARIACQTCHIPRFSKTQFTKVDWDWSTAGDNVTCGGAPGTCTAGVSTATVDDLGNVDPASTSTVTTYDYIKGTFRWQRNVTPAYRWSNGKASHVRLSDRTDLTAAGLTPADADRITLGEPAGDATNGKIRPFKLMRGRQPMYIDGANGYVINPNLFGPNGFWGVVQAAGYSYPTYDFDGAGPLAPGQESVDALWGKILGVGAFGAGQAATNAALPKWDGVNPGYDWRYTKLYMDMNHEVAPKGEALGKAGCTDCHSASPRIPMCELYAGRAKPWGVVCP